MNGCRERAWAKVNLFLDVVGTREDGYHLLRSVMQSISLSDELTLSPWGGIEIVCDDPTVPAGEDNLIYKALRALKVGARVHLEKHIPLGGGLGGGSSDAAAALRAANRVYGLGYSPEELERIGSSIGSDVPFCVRGGTALVSGAGERVEPIKRNFTLWMVLVNPGIPISTGEIYRAFDKLHYNSDEGRLPRFLRAWDAGDVAGLSGSLYNALELTAIPRYPIIQEIKDHLLSSGCLGASMSGSGSTSFGIAPSQEEAHRIKDKFTKWGVASSFKVFVVEAVG
ncbi:MAG: 4-(cytidine 5'-diphospho)-2-C-methyl-D-erythritol kinase [bacterium]